MKAQATPAASSANYQTPVHIHVNATATWCNNNNTSPPAEVTIDSTLTIPTGLDAALTFENNDNNPGNHTLTVTGQLAFTITPANGSIAIPKQPVDGGSGGDPWIWLGLTSPDGSLLALTDGSHTSLPNPVMIGRCVQGLQLASIDGWFSDPSLVQALVSSISCTNAGSNLVINMSGDHNGVNGAIVFDNNQNKFSWMDAPPGAHESDPKKGEVAAGFTLTGLTFPDPIFKGSPEGPGGNPLVVLGITDSNGKTVLPQTNLGRCKQLSA